MKIKEILMMLFVFITIAVLVNSYKEDFSEAQEEKKIVLSPNWREMSLDDFKKDTLYVVDGERELPFKHIQRYGAGYTVTPRDTNKYQFFVIMFYVLDKDTVKWSSNEGWYPINLNEL